MFWHCLLAQVIASGFFACKGMGKDIAWYYLDAVGILASTIFIQIVHADEERLNNSRKHKSFLLNGTISRAMVLSR